MNTHYIVQIDALKFKSSEIQDVQTFIRNFLKDNPTVWPGRIRVSQVADCEVSIENGTATIVVPGSPSIIAKPQSLFQAHYSLSEIGKAEPLKVEDLPESARDLVESIHLTRVLRELKHLEPSDVVSASDVAEFRKIVSSLALTKNCERRNEEAANGELPPGHPTDY